MPTALELSRDGWKPYLEAARKRPAPPQPSAAERQERQRILSRIRKAAKRLKSDFQVKRVVLFGSLAHEGWFVPDSDVDLVVEGLAPDAYWEAWRIVEEVIGDRLVDLIEIQSAGASLRQAIERYGVEL